MVVPFGIEFRETLRWAESGLYAILGRKNNRDMMSIAAARPAISITISNADAIRPFRSQKAIKALKPIQRFFGMTSLAPQPLQAKGFPRPHWVFQKGTGSPQLGHGGVSVIMPE